MTIHKVVEPAPPPASSACGESAAGAAATTAAEVGNAIQGELSPIGLLCDGILSVINATSSLPESARATVGAQVCGILEMFREHEERERFAMRKISALNSERQRLKEQLAVLRQEHFDKSSEKGIAGEEEDLDVSLADDEEDDEPCEKPTGKRPRKIPKGIEPVVVHHYPENRNCNCCGREMPSISSWSSLRMVTVPEHVEFIRHVHHTCACNHNEHCKDNKPVSAKSDNHIMKGRGIDPTFAAEAAVQKFFEHIPTFRMERRLRNANVNLSRQAIGSGIAHLASHLEPVRQALLDHVKAGHAAHADETPVRVQAPGKGKCDQGYFWAICRDERGWNPKAEPAVVYFYAPSRAGSVIEELLSGASFRYLISDGYAGYNRLFQDDDLNDRLVSARCWAHARRNFHEAFLATKSPLAKRIVQMIRKMYAVEKAARGLPPEARTAMRQERTLPVLAEIRAELLKAESGAQGTLKKAVNYTLKAFDALQRFAFDGRLEIDNNPIERCIRGIALTKKNSLFAGSHDAAQVWAVYYSLIESARLNRINPRSYLNWVVGEIERNQGDVDLSTLMPWHCPVGQIED